MLIVTTPHLDWDGVLSSEPIDTRGVPSGQSASDNELPTQDIGPAPWRFRIDTEIDGRKSWVILRYRAASFRESVQVEPRDSRNPHLSSETAQDPFSSSIVDTILSTRIQSPQQAESSMRSQFALV